MNGFARMEHARRRTHEGSGIGLALVHELLTMHGGNISVQSQVGKGTTFTVSLPYGSTHLPKGVSGPSPASRLLPARHVKHLCRKLSAGCRVMQVADNASRRDLEAARCAERAAFDRRHKPRVLLVDDNRDMRDYVLACWFRVLKLPPRENGREALEKRNQRTSGPGLERRDDAGNGWLPACWRRCGKILPHLPCRWSCFQPAPARNR